uniref:Uncharacterized protein n=1 Tax=Anguilla anguilla TaxID=7936 RepID=A0A0E9T9S4_ANGAN
MGIDGWLEGWVWEMIVLARW